MDNIDNSNEVSKYNEAGLQIQRLHFSWLQIKYYAKNGNFRDWFFALDDIWRELIADVEQRLPDCEEIKNKHRELRNRKCKTKKEAYEALDERHCFLKVIQDRVGKGGSYQDSNADEFD